MTSETLYLLPDRSIVTDLPEDVECYSVLHTTLRRAERDVYYRLAWVFGSELAARMFSAVLSQLYLRSCFGAAEYHGAMYYALIPMPEDKFLGYVGRADGNLLAKELMAQRSIVNEAATREAEKLKRWERSLEEWADELEAALGALRAPRYLDQS